MNLCLLLVLLGFAMYWAPCGTADPEFVKPEKFSRKHRSLEHELLRNATRAKRQLDGERYGARYNCVECLCRADCSVAPVCGPCPYCGQECSCYPDPNGGCYWYCFEQDPC